MQQQQLQQQQLIQNPQVMGYPGVNNLNNSGGVSVNISGAMHPATAQDLSHVIKTDNSMMMPQHSESNMNQPSGKSALETQAASAMAHPQRENQCVFHGCKNISPFTCKLSVFGKEFGCGQHFCTEHKGEISMLIFEKFQINDDDIFKERESICY